jgi:DnaD/phage-associated family protein
MLEREFELSGPETITLAINTVDKLLRAGDGDAALLYLYMLKTHDKVTPEKAAAAMGKSKGWVASAMAMLSKLNLIKYDENTDEPQPNAPIGEPARYTVDEIIQEIESGTSFSALIDYTQRSFGRILKPDELERLFVMYDFLRLPAEVVMLLITHCITESKKRGSGRMPSFRFIEGAAFEWEREGIFSLERAEEYLKAHETHKTIQGEIKNVLQIKDRELTATEMRYVNGWITLGYDSEAIEIAYDRTITHAGNLSMPYMDKIISTWHNRGIKTPEDIIKKDQKPTDTRILNNQKTSGKKHGEANQDEIVRMQRQLEKMKED